jgi:hypothetical protein
MGIAFIRLLLGASLFAATPGRASEGEHCSVGAVACYVDTIPRVLGNVSVAVGPITLESCALLCHKAGFSLAGAEAGGQCFCGNQLTPSAAKAPDSECDEQCSGNDRQFCGGNWRMSVFDFECSTPWTTCGALAPQLNRTACPLDQATCCTQQWMPSDGNWGCCPYPDAVCCPNGFTCCPSVSPLKGLSSFDPSPLAFDPCVASSTD